MVLPTIAVLDFIPTPLKVLFALVIFVLIGTLVINVLLFGWNVLFVNTMNHANGCIVTDLFGTVLPQSDPSKCIPEVDGLYLGGFNFADFWVLMGVFFFPPLIFFAFKWYATSIRPIQR